MTIKHTVTLFDLLQSELISRGYNEFENNGKWTFFNDEFSFMRKIMKFDNEVYEIVNELFFQNEKLNDNESDRHFKKTFIKKFLNNSINRQTVEAFSEQVVYTFLVNYDYINHVYHIDDFLTGTMKNESSSNDKKLSDSRVLHSDLPQTEVNLNVDNTVLDYGTTNTISRNRDTGESGSTAVAKQYNIDTLIKISGLLEGVYVEFNKQCFMQAF